VIGLEEFRHNIVYGGEIGHGYDHHGAFDRFFQGAAGGLHHGLEILQGSTHLLRDAAVDAFPVAGSAGSRPEQMTYPLSVSEGENGARFFGDGAI
jgi:hypothetical protein